MNWGSTRRAFPVLIVAPDQIDRAVKLNPPAIELRLDLGKFLQPSTRACPPGIPVLATVRRKVDGGRWARSERERLSLLRRASAFADAIDVETDVDLRVECAVIASFHSFKGEPKLDPLIKRAKEMGAVRLKVAVRTRHPEDLASWARAKSSRAMPITAIALGRAGQWTRWQLPLELGGPAYAPLGRPVAPGQISYKKLIELLS